VCIIVGSREHLQILRIVSDIDSWLARCLINLQRLGHSSEHKCIVSRLCSADSATILTGIIYYSPYRIFSLNGFGYFLSKPPSKSIILI
jgi:hypothetical protein